MPTNVLTEKDYQKYIINKLINDNGYILRKDNDFDRLFALDREMLFNFLNDTQPDEMETLAKIYKDDLEDTIVNFINNEATKKTRIDFRSIKTRYRNIQSKIKIHV